MEARQLNASLSQSESISQADKPYTPRMQHLWTDKHRPQKFADLIGNERLHREVMHWLKQWDGCVFNMKPKHKPKEDEHPTIDKHGRPLRKILFLSGPPGFGKTTLAHVAARHAGYNVIEVNASDERGGKALTDRIAQALSSHDVTNSKPNCLIIDEIDGALGGASDNSLIKCLLDLVTKEGEPLKSLSTNSKRKKQSRQILQRPIICIANDQYAAALRPLRACSAVISFQAPTISVIVNRLRGVCEIEGLRAESRALHALCEMSNCDIRSCLNALQMASQKTAYFDMSTLSHAMAGRKDLQQSMFHVLKTLFLLPTGKRSAALIRQGVKQDKYVNRLEEMVSGSGEMDKIVQGCFEGYLNGSFHDAGFTKINSCLEWLHLYDRAQMATIEDQRYELYQYMPFAPVAFHQLATTMPPKTEYPRVDYEQRTAQRDHLNTTDIMRSGFNPRLWRMFNRRQISCELLQPLLEIISPELKPVSIHPQSFHS